MEVVKYLIKKRSVLQVLDILTRKENGCTMQLQWAGTLRESIKNRDLVCLGPTLDQMLNFLKVKVTEELNSLSSQLVTLVFADGGSLGEPRLSFANGVWVYQSLNFKPSFKETVDNAYKAAASHVDFQTKANDLTASIDISVLQERLTNMINLG
ncbi:SERPIN domain-containing protein [Forsythia ovata]|uniref:SERPIN domain-containing protein n=1 Tax=Forsythia ovata TaxID=205694 RepID=A0ABD1P5N2_9LAMI